MEFDKSRVYTALNADELKVGSKVIVADSMFNLRQHVDEDKYIEVLDDIEPDDVIKRFVIDNVRWNLAYLVSEPEEKKLKWTDLKIGDIISDGGISYMITGIDTDSNTQSHVHFDGEWRGDFELEDWKKVE